MRHDEDSYQEFSRLLVSRYKGARQDNIDLAYKLYTAGERYPWDAIRERSSIVPSHPSWSSGQFSKNLSIFLSKNWRLNRHLGRVLTLAPETEFSVLAKEIIGHGEKLSSLTRDLTYFNVAKRQTREMLSPSHYPEIIERLKEHISNSDIPPTSKGAVRPESESLISESCYREKPKYLGVLAGVGMIGHGLYRAINSNDKITNSDHPRRNWTKTFLGLGEAGIGAGITWTSFVSGQKGIGKYIP